MGLLELEERLVNAMLDTITGQNVLCNKAIPDVYWYEVSKWNQKGYNQ